MTSSSLLHGGTSSSNMVPLPTHFPAGTSIMHSGGKIPTMPTMAQGSMYTEYTPSRNASQAFTTTGAASAIHALSTMGDVSSPNSKEHTRKVSSVIIGQELMKADIPDPAPTVTVREPQVIYQDKRERKEQYQYHEVVMPKEVVQWVEVDVPQTEVVPRPIPMEVVEYVDQIVYQPKYVDVPREYTVEVKKPVYYEEIREEHYPVPGPIEEKIVEEIVPREIPVPEHVDTPAHVLVAQTVVPQIVHGHNVIDCDVKVFEPSVTLVDVHVLKSVDVSMAASAELYQHKETFHRMVTVPAAQYNSILRELNATLVSTDVAFLEQLPYQRDGSGHVPFLTTSPKYVHVDPAKLVNFKHGTTTHHHHHLSTTGATTTQHHHAVSRTADGHSVMVVKERVGEVIPSAQHSYATSTTNHHQHVLPQSVPPKRNKMCC